MNTSVSLLERLAAQPTDDDWRLFNDLYRPLLLEWLARTGVADADDLAQEVLLVVWKEISAFDRRKPGSFRAWLRKILAHRVRDHFRGKKYRPQATGESDFRDRLAELESPGSALSKLWDREHDEHVAGRLMARVRDEFEVSTWEAFRRHVLDGLSTVEVAKELGTSVNAVLLAKSRILKRMRAETAGFVESERMQVASE
jgi:RNA polymerase sigma-70 factor (ECF subfamily)